MTPPQTARESTQKPRNGTSNGGAGRGVWIGVIAGLGFVVAANAVMISVAVSNQPALETEDHYGDAMHYNEVIAARAASNALGWKVTVEPCEGDVSACDFDISVADASGDAVEGLEGEVALRRADTTELDRSSHLVARGGGRYGAEFDLGAPGLYELQMNLHSDAGDFVEKRRVVVHED